MQRSEAGSRSRAGLAQKGSRCAVVLGEKDIEGSLLTLPRPEACLHCSRQRGGKADEAERGGRAGVCLRVR